MIESIVYRLGWTLVHFLWQGAVIALVLLFALALLRKRSANARYLAATVAMFLLAIVPLLTFAVMPEAGPGAANNAETATAPVAKQPEPAAPAAPAEPVTKLGANDGPPASQIADSGGKPASGQVPSASIPATEAPGSGAGTADLQALQRPGHAESREPGGTEKTPTPALGSVVEDVLPWVVVSWLVGVALLAFRLLAGWVSLQWFTQRQVRPVKDAVLNSLLAVLAQRLGIRYPIRLVESALVQVPMVIGWLRPVVLLPISALTGLSVRQWEAILAHELAHIRRHDYLVNLLQSVVETLLFYHPAVWWVSRHMRLERENCCDDMAVSLCGDRMTFARALTQLEVLRRQPAPICALAITGGALMSRIRRLFGLPDTPRHRSLGWLAGLVVLAGLIAGAAGLVLLSPPEPIAASNPVEPELKPADNHSENKDPQAEKPKPEITAAQKPADPEEKKLVEMIQTSDRIVVVQEEPVFLLKLKQTLKGPHQGDQAVPRNDALLIAMSQKAAQKWVLFLKAEEHTQNWATVSPLREKDWYLSYSEELVKKIQKELTAGFTWGQAVKGMALGLRLRPTPYTTYLPGKAVVADVALRNVGDAPIKIQDLRYNIYDYWPTLQFDVTDPAGKTWKLAKPVGPMNEADMPNPRTLKPGEVYLHAIHIDEWPIDDPTGEFARKIFQFNKPGKYQIQAVYQNQKQLEGLNWTGQLQSNQVALTVKEDKTQRLLETVKKTPTNYAFWLTWHGKPTIKGQRETRSLFLFGHNIGEKGYNARVVENHEFPPEQMIQLAEFLAKDGFFERAKEATFDAMFEKKYDGYSWLLWETGKDTALHEKLGWSPAVLKKLEALRGALKGKAAQEMDGLLKDLGSGPAKDQETQQALEAIKKAPSKYSFWLTWHGKKKIKDQRETRSLILFGFKIGDVKHDARVVESFDFPPEQVIAVAELLAKDGFFERAKEVPLDVWARTSFEGYVLTVMSEDSQPLWYEKLGWNPAILKKLDALRGALKGKAGQEMDAVLAEWEPQRKLWQKEKPSPK